MKSLFKSKVVFAIILTCILSITLSSNDAEACRPGEVYAEGNRFLGICWGHSSDECAKCIDAQQ